MIILVVFLLLRYTVNDIDWKEQKQFFNTAIKISFVFLLFGTCSTYDNRLYSLKTTQKKENLILEKDAIFDSYSTHSGKNSTRIPYIGFKFQGFDTIFRIDSLHYKYAYGKDVFSKEILKGDTVTIYHYKSYIWSLQKNGKEYCNLDGVNKSIIKSNLHTKERKIWWVSFSILIIVLNFILLFYDDTPSFNYAAIYWVIILALWIYLASVVGCESDKDFFKLFYKYTPPQ